MSCSVQLSTSANGKATDSHAIMLTPKYSYILVLRSRQCWLLFCRLITVNIICGLLDRRPRPLLMRGPLCTLVCVPSTQHADNI